MTHSEKSSEIYEVFVSMPYGTDPTSHAYWSRFYRDGILTMKALLEGKGYSVNFLRPKEEPSALRLKDSVKTTIDRCSICLAVITGLNPNVFWEVGYAESQGKPVILVVEEGLNEAQYSPVLVAEALKEFYNGKIFDKELTDQAQVLDFQERLLRYVDLAVKVVRGLEKPTPQFRVFSDREGTGLPQAIAAAEHTIDLITSNLSYFADTERFVVQNAGERVFAFDPPIGRDVRVRILALNPDSSKEHDVAGYREQLRAAATFLYHRYMLQQNVDIRIYDDLPLQIAVLIDGRAITSIASRGHQARHNIHMEFDLEYRGARATFEEHFAEVLASQAQTFHISRFAWAQKR